MRPKQRETAGSGDLFRAKLDQIVNMKHELVQLAGKLDSLLGSTLQAITARQLAGKLERHKCGLAESRPLQHSVWLHVISIPALAHAA